MPVSTALVMRRIGVDFLGEDRRHGGIDALPHLDLWHDKRRLAGAVDSDERIGRELAAGVVRPLHRIVPGTNRNVEGKQQAARQHRCGDRSLAFLAHLQSPAFSGDVGLGGGCEAVGGEFAVLVAVGAEPRGRAFLQTRDQAPTRLHRHF